MPGTTERSIGTIDPHARHAEFIGWPDIGAQALPHVENPFTRNTDAYALGGDHEVEAEREFAARAFQRRGGECRPFPLVDGDAEVDRDPIEASVQNLGLERRRAFLLDIGASTIQRQEKILVRSTNAVLIGPPAEEHHDGRLPINEGSVNVKGHRVEIGELKPHRFLAYSIT